MIIIYAIAVARKHNVNYSSNILSNSYQMDCKGSTAWTPWTFYTCKNSKMV